MRFSVETDAWFFSIEGTPRKTRWTSQDPTQPPRLDVNLRGDALQRLDWDSSSRGVPGALTYTGVGPALFEETAYKVTVMNKRGSPAGFRHQDPSLIENVTSVAGQSSILSGTINFRSQVGRSAFELDDGSSRLEVIVEVRPSKLDYESDYEALRESVSGLARQLVLEFLRATYGGGKAAGDQTGTRRLDWLLLLRDEVDRLESALAHIVGHPHAQLVREVEFQTAEKIRKPTTATRRAVARGQGQGPWTSSPVALRHRTRLPNLSATETLDTPEHRWLKTQLAFVATTVAQVRSDYAARTSRSLPETGRRSLRSKAIVDELQQFEDTLAPYLNVSPLADAVGDAAPSFSSLVLQGRPGYRDAYQSLLRLRMAIRVNGDVLALPLRDLSDLYEMWCFVAIVNLVAQTLDAEIDLAELMKLEDTGTRVRLKPGQGSSVAFNFGRDRVNVVYNREYWGRTGTQKPDIIIEVIREGMAPVVLILDAKYRVETSDSYLATSPCPGPPSDAVAQLHRYRDAITVNWAGAGRGRPVVRAVALFPLGADDSLRWTEHNFFASVSELGIGALPFLPDNMAWVSDWIAESLSAPDDKLAWPGPPFLAWESIKS